MTVEELVIALESLHFCDMYIAEVWNNELGENLKIDSISVDDIKHVVTINAVLQRID